ncbi:MAG: hypothetical protein H7039_18960 [Bryobacteraceae bacterium]|nr:hypothetical protein [Bryobacteraceae bacterium]
MKPALLLLLGCVAAHSATIVSVGGPVSFVGSVGSNQSLTAGFTTGQAYENVQISALLSGIAGQTFNAYLTTSIGPGTTVADQVAFTTAAFTGFSMDTVVFTGLSLTANTYYLTLFNPENTNGAWSSTNAPVVTAAPGSSHAFSGYFITNDSPLPYPPAADFANLLEESGRTLIYTVQTVAPVPEASTLGMTVLAGISLFAFARRRAS